MSAFFSLSLVLLLVPHGEPLSKVHGASFVRSTPFAFATSSHTDLLDSNVSDHRQLNFDCLEIEEDDTDDREQDASASPAGHESDRRLSSQRLCARIGQRPSTWQKIQKIRLRC